MKTFVALLVGAALAAAAFWLVPLVGLSGRDLWLLAIGAVVGLVVGAFVMLALAFPGGVGRIM